MPRIRDYSDGLFRRVSIIPLERQFIGAEADPHLLETLTGELDAITSRALDALGQLINRKGKFTRPSSSVAALTEWRLENNHLADFVAEKLYEDPKGSIGVQAAYDAYVGWFAVTGLCGMLGRKQFSKRLAALLRMPSKRSAEGYTFQGVSLR